MWQWIHLCELIKHRSECGAKLLALVCVAWPVHRQPMHWCASVGVILRPALQFPHQLWRAPSDFLVHDCM